MQNEWADVGRRVHEFVATLTPAKRAEIQRRLWHDDDDRVLVQQQQLPIGIFVPDRLPESQPVFLGVPRKDGDDRAEHPPYQCPLCKERETPEQIVVDQTSCSLEEARDALALKNGDVIEAILYVTR